MGVKKASLYVHFEGLTTDSYFGKTWPPERKSYRRKKAFVTTLLMRKHDFWPVQWFLNGQKWVVKTASLYVHFEDLTTDSYFGKTRPPGRMSYRRKKGFCYHSSDEKTWFLTCPVVFKWSKMGVKKASLYVHFEGLTTDSYFGKTWPPERRSYRRKKAFVTTLLMRKHDFWPVQWFLNGQKWVVKTASLYVHFEDLTTDSYFGKTRPPGRMSYRRKKGFCYHSSDEKTWFLTCPVVFKWSKIGG